MGEGVFNSPNVSLPDAEAAMTAAVDSINANGGVNGHKLTLDLCDDKFDPNLASTCARTAVSNHDVAVVSAFSAFTPQIVPILAAAGIPFINEGPAAPIDFTSPDEFPLSGGTPVAYASVGQELVEAGCKKVGAVVDGTTVNEQAAVWLEKGVKSKGASYVSVQVSDSAVDFTSPVAQLESDGAQCLVPDTPPPFGAKIVTAVEQSGKKLPIGAVSAEFSDQTLKTLGSQADGLIMTQQEHRPADPVPAVTAMKNAMAKYTPSTPATDPFSSGAWAAVNVTASIIGQIQGAVTAASVLSAAKATTAVNSAGMLGNFSFAAAAPAPALPRVKNFEYLTWKVNNGAAQLVSNNFTLLTGIS
jgi:ABC-type branched-subunit amino acid transport system substrate-binding protein